MRARVAGDVLAVACRAVAWGAPRLVAHASLALGRRLARRGGLVSWRALVAGPGLRCRASLRPTRTQHWLSWGQWCANAIREGGEAFKARERLGPCLGCVAGLNAREHMVIHAAEHLRQLTCTAVQQEVSSAGAGLTESCCHLAGLAGGLGAASLRVSCTAGRGTGAGALGGAAVTAVAIAPGAGAAGAAAGAGASGWVALPWVKNFLGLYVCAASFSCTHTRARRWPNEHA